MNCLSARISKTLAYLISMNDTMLYLASFGTGYFLLRTIYRLWFHPLSKFPGPKLAAVSHLHEFYYDVIKGGTYIWQVEKMHKKYGKCWQHDN
jgi:hypothetical protein